MLLSFSSTPWTSCHMAGRLVRVVEKCWCLYSLKGPIDVSLFCILEATSRICKATKHIPVKARDYLTCCKYHKPRNVYKKIRSLWIFCTDCLWMDIFTESNRKSVLVLLENTGRLSCFIKHQFCQAKCLVNRAFTLLTSNSKRRKSCRKQGFPNVYESYVTFVMPERQNLLIATKMERSSTNTINKNIVNWLLYIEV